MVGHTLGVFVGIEAKTIKGKISPQQELRLGEIAAAHGGSLVVWGSDDVAKIGDYVWTAKYRRVEMGNQNETFYSTPCTRRICWTPCC